VILQHIAGPNVPPDVPPGLQRSAPLFPGLQAVRAMRHMRRIFPLLLLARAHTP
jgi:hypothetical protein